VVLAIEPFDPVAVAGPKMLKAPVLERMIPVKALVIRRIVAVPVIVADVLMPVDFPVIVPLHLRPRMLVAFRRGRRDSSLVRSWIVGGPSFGSMGTLSVLPFVRMLGHRRYGCQQQKNRQLQFKTSLHSSSSKAEVRSLLLSVEWDQALTSDYGAFLISWVQEFSPALSLFLFTILSSASIVLSLILRLCEETVMPSRPFSRFLLLFALLLPLFFFVCDAKTLYLDDSDENSHLCLYTGDTLTIKLISNPTTGYSWTNADSPSNLELLASRSSPGTADRLGAPGYQTFSFRATKPDESTLVLNYLRPFEKNTPPAKRFRLFITVEARPAVSQLTSPKA
jgi:inhibitor of cysteine peptidase